MSLTHTHQQHERAETEWKTPWYGETGKHVVLGVDGDGYRRNQRRWCLANRKGNMSSASLAEYTHGSTGWLLWLVDWRSLDWIGLG